MKVVALALVLGVMATTAGSVLAYRGDPGATGPNFSTERHESMLNAFENEDYDAWKELMPAQSRVTQVITEENFEKFAEAHALALQGKTEEAQQIREQLGLGERGEGRGDCDGRGAGHGRGFNR